MFIGYPIVNLLEGDDINAQHIKAVPKQNTGVKDAERIAKLFLHDLFKASKS